MPCVFFFVMEEVFRILLVDDDSRVHEMVAKISSLASNDAGVQYVLDHAYTPQDADRLVSEKNYDVVIVNSKYGEEYWPYILPDGFFDSVMKMKEHGCVVVSYSGLGLNNQQELWQNRKEGFVDRYITKDNPVKLIEYMEDLMNAWRDRRKAQSCQ